MLDVVFTFHVLIMHYFVLLSNCFEKACEDVSKKGAAVLSAKEQGFESANKPADEVTEHLVS
jgi:hypothetical protein